MRKQKKDGASVIGQSVSRRSSNSEQGRKKGAIINGIGKKTLDDGEKT